MSLNTLISNEQDYSGAVGNLLITQQRGDWDKNSLSDAVLLMRGMTFEGDETSVPRVLVKFGDLSPNDIDMDLDLPLQGAANALTVGYAAVHPGMLPLRTTCEQLVEQTLSIQGSVICSALHGILDELKKGALRIEHPPKDIGAGRAHWQLFVAPVLSGNLSGSLNLVGKSGCAVARILRLYFEDLVEMRLLLDPVGDIMGGRVTFFEPHANEESIIREHRVYVGPNLVPIETSTISLGNTEALRLHFEEFLDGGGEDPPALPTDGFMPHMAAPVRAMVVESALGFSVPALTYRFDVNRKAIKRFVRSGKIDEPIFSGFLANSRLEAAWSLVSAEALGEHGTLVSLLLAADLPQLKISWLPTSVGGWASNPNRARDLVRSKIQRDRPRVVNISATFHDDFPNCGEVFDPIFSEFSDTVLFVVAAGNDGTYNATSTCPGAIANRHSNAMTVGGVGSDGRLHPMSNYGATVDVAAPYTHPLEEGEGGTSFAAPVVANAALRLWGRHPWLSPSQVKGILLDTCRQDSLDVLCGGALDIERLARETRWQEE